MKTSVQILVLLAACAALAAAPVPTDAQLEERRADIEELTRSDYAALDKGKMTHAELGASLLDYAKNAEDPSDVFMLRRAAFRQYVLGGDVPAASNLYERIVRGSGAEYAQALARFSARQVGKLVQSRKDGAKELMDRLTAVEKRVRNVEAARALAEQTPDDLALREKFAAALALAGDWPAALVQYSRLGGRVGELGLFERRYPRTGVTLLTTADVADHWWSYPEEARLGADDAREFRLRAAKWYRLAVANGVLRGVRRQIAEKRVQEAEAEAK